MSNVYYTKIDSTTTVEEVQAITRKLLSTLIEKENVKLEEEIPLKLHFGEKGNKTFIKAENYDGVIDFLKEKNIKSSFMETNVLYGGHRNTKENHKRTAEEHNFTGLPIVIADGEHGEDFSEVEVNQKHFESCKIGKKFLDYKQLIVLAHFKGHMFAGFGGAIKQLAMGFASKGGKLAMHMSIKPKIKSRKCKQCHLCEKRCNENAITIAKKSFISNDKCVGCGACVSICPHGAISIMRLKGILRALFLKRTFREKLIEYAYAAQKDKKHLYVNFGMNITKGCDCEPKEMKPLMDDFGIYASCDPVAIDKACYDECQKRGKKFKGSDQFKYGELIGLGSADYNLMEVKQSNE